MHSIKMLMGWTCAVVLLAAPAAADDCKDILQNGVWDFQISSDIKSGSQAFLNYLLQEKQNDQVRQKGGSVQVFGYGNGKYNEGQPKH